MSKPYDRIIVIDAETAWGRGVKLGFSCQTNEEYVRDPRFKAWGLCWKEFGAPGKAIWVRGKDLNDWVQTIDWSRTAVIAQNAQFDVCILAWHYDAHPAFIFDTLSMGRALRGVEVGNSLKKLAQDFELPDKGQGLASSENYLDELPFHIEQELADYCRHDVFLCEEIFKRLNGMVPLPDGTSYPPYPLSELRLIDMTLKMYTQPKLVLDREMLAEGINEEREIREGLLARLGVTDAMLSSNPQFAALLESLGCAAPLKTSKTTGEQTFALAKNDALFQALLNGENEDVALLCEARLKVKSTSERTRAQRFLDIAHRGTLPVPLSYYGAATGRYAAAKGSAINMQNLKRGSFLRKAIMAPDGYVLVVGDLSQIEPRVLAWMSDYEDLLNIFRSGQDAYAQFGSQMFNIPGMTKDSHPDLRQSAKSALLGCFGADTPVLTQRGWVPIVQVQATDMVWDGEAWVKHQGLVPQGEKEVLTQYGISATSDHEILTERGWVAWSAALANPSLLKSGLSLANLPVSGGNDDRMAPNGKAGLLTNHKCAVHVGGWVSSSVPICGQEELHAATVAQKRKQRKHAWLLQGTRLFAQIASTVTDCLTVLAQSLSAALTRTVLRIPIMGAGELLCTRHGSQIALNSCGISLHYRDLMRRNCSLIASTTTVGMFPATFASSRAVRMGKTNAHIAHEQSNSLTDALQPLKQRMQTYDLAYAGPRNRYTILTSEGPLIVHNCGYGLGWASFAAQLLVGFLGAPPVRYDMAFAKKLGVTRQYVEKFLDWDENVKKLEAIPHTCTTKELLIHCVAAKKIIDIYRETAHPVTTFWEMCGTLLETALYGGEEFRYKCLVFRKEEIVLPNGMSLRYPNLRRTKDDRGRYQYVYGKDDTKLYPGKITNNVIQGASRIVMTDGMLRTFKRYPVVGSVHDEQIVMVPEEQAEEGRKWILEQMIVEPKYMPGIPLAVEGGVHKRYGLAKK